MADPAAEHQRRRPIGIRILVALAVLQGVLLVAVGSALVALHDDPGVQDALDTDGTTAGITGVVFVVVGVVQLALAVGLRRGRPLARSVYGAVATVQTATNVYALVALRDVRAGSVWALALSIAVLWFLYGTDETEEYFRHDR